MGARALIELIGFQLVWILCALSAASGRSALALVACSLFTIGAILLSESRAALAQLSLVGGAIGCVVETLLIYLGAITHVTTWPSPQFAPLWMIGLWIAFGATLPATARLLGSRAVMKSLPAGVIFGPLAYLAGSRLGALEVAAPELISLGMIAIIWGAVLPLLVAAAGVSVADRHDRRS